VAINLDFRDLFAALNAAGARYLLVGGYAVAFHAEPVPIIGRVDPIRNKRASGRPQDLLDLEILERA
jgi:hypothetical protein